MFWVILSLTKVLVKMILFRNASTHWPRGSQIFFFLFLENIFFFLNFICLFWILVAACRIYDLRHVGSSSLSRDWTWVPFIRSAESQPLDHWGSPCLICRSLIIRILMLVQILGPSLRDSDLVCLGSCLRFYVLNKCFRWIWYLDHNLRNPTFVHLHKPQS